MEKNGPSRSILRNLSLRVNYDEKYNKSIFQILLGSIILYLLYYYPGYTISTFFILIYFLYPLIEE